MYYNMLPITIIITKRPTFYIKWTGLFRVLNSRHNVDIQRLCSVSDDVIF